MPLRVNRPSNNPLEKNDVHIWCIDLDSQPIELEPLWLLLAPQEKSRAEKFHFALDQRRYVAAHGILRQLLGIYLGMEAAGLKFQCGKNGKPHLAARQNEMGLSFNLAHSHGIGLCGLSTRRAIGVDKKIGMSIAPSTHRAVSRALALE